MAQREIGIRRGGLAAACACTTPVTRRLPLSTPSAGFSEAGFLLSGGLVIFAPPVEERSTFSSSLN